MEYFQETFSHPEIDGDQSSPKKWETVSAIATAADTSNGCFECNICLDHARDPVVTLCGHLYCWPCIYKWLDFNNNTFPSDNLPQQPRCPVCKADVSSSTLVPLYGRGWSSPKTDSDGKASSGIEIPNRPPAYGVHAMISNQLQSQFESDQHQQHDQQNYNTHAATATAASPLRFNLGGTMAHPMVFMLCEMVPARMFGNSTTEYRNSYHRIGSTPRMRRQEMKDEKSLHRISIFIFCCVVLFFLLC